MTLAATKPSSLIPVAPRIRCKHCKKRFLYTRWDALTCSAACKQAHYRTRVAKSFAGFSDTTYGLWLIKQIRRAGTVEIITKTLLDSYQVWVSCRDSNGYRDPTTTSSSRYEVSHICPVNGRNNSGSSVIGTLDVANIVVAPGWYNRSRANSWDGHSGHFIKQEALQSRYKVTDKTTVKSIIAKIAELVPAEFEALLTTLKLTISKRVTDTKFLIKRGVAAPALLAALPREQFQELVKLHRLPPKRQTMINRLAKQPGSEFNRKPELLEVLDDAALTEAYKLTYVDSYHVERAAAYDVYASGALGLGLTIHASHDFHKNPEEFWDNLHGLPLVLPEEEDFSAYAYASLYGCSVDDIRSELEACQEQSATDSFTHP